MASQAALGRAYDGEQSALEAGEFMMTDSLLQIPIAKWPRALAAWLTRWWHLRAGSSSEAPTLSALLRGPRNGPWRSPQLRLADREDSNQDQ